jgi:hypothetical protein
MQILFDLPPRFSARCKSPHVRDYTLRIIKIVLANFNFETTTAVGTYIYPFKGKLSQWLATRFPRLGEKIIVVSEKHQKTLMLAKSKKVVWNVIELAKKRGDSNPNPPESRPFK